MSKNTLYLECYEGITGEMVLGALRELAEEQQVLLFTCHGREREQMKGAPDVTVLSL